MKISEKLNFYFTEEEALSILQDMENSLWLITSSGENQGGTGTKFNMVFNKLREVYPEITKGYEWMVSNKIG